MRESLLAFTPLLSILFYAQATVVTVTATDLSSVEFVAERLESGMINVEKASCCIGETIDLGGEHSTTHTHTHTHESKETTRAK